jgi:hypothetical protein
VSGGEPDRQIHAHKAGATGDEQSHASG